MMRMMFDGYIGRTASLEVRMVDDSAEALDALRRSEASCVTWGSILAEVLGERGALESRTERRAAT